MIYRHKNGITLIKASFQHLPQLLALKQESWYGTHRVALINEDDQRRWLDSVTKSHDCLYLIAYGSEEESIGVYKINNVDWISHCYDSAHDVFLPFRGKGYGKTVLEAGIAFGFEVLNMHRHNTEVLANNSISLKCVRWAGYAEEGIRRKAIHKCGRWLDSILFGMLREDWENLPMVKKYGGCCNLNFSPEWFS